MPSAPAPADPSGNFKPDSKLAEVLQRYEPYLLRIVQRRFPKDCVGRFGVSDVIQETLFKVHQNLDQFRGESETDFRAWLAAVLVNTLHKMREHHQRPKREAGREEPLNAAAMLAGMGQPTPSAEVLRKEQNERMRSAIDRLPTDYRQVVELRNLDLLPFGEIGERMGRTEDAVQKLWCRAVRRLEELLKTDA